jgi:integrase
MAKTKPLAVQMHTALVGCDSRGASKRGAAPQTRECAVYSDNRMRGLVDRSKHFCRWLAANHSEVRFLRDIDSAITTEYVNAHANRWTGATRQEVSSALSKLGRVAGQHFGFDGDWRPTTPPEAPAPAGKLRNVRMADGDIAAIRADLAATAKTPSGTDTGLLALELGLRAGLRSQEIARLHSDSINLEDKRIELRHGRRLTHSDGSPRHDGAKGSRDRDVRIREADIEFFSVIKARCEEQSGYLFPSPCGGDEYSCIKATNISGSVTRAIKRIEGRGDSLSADYRGANASCHAVRKATAQRWLLDEIERLSGERPAIETVRETVRAGGLGVDETIKRAWSTVQQELGHGAKGRRPLFNDYICTAN